MTPLLVVLALSRMMRVAGHVQSSRIARAMDSSSTLPVLIQPSISILTMVAATVVLARAVAVAGELRHCILHQSSFATNL
jgi:hypothetical protein